MTSGLMIAGTLAVFTAATLGMGLLAPDPGETSFSSKDRPKPVLALSPLPTDTPAAVVMARAVAAETEVALPQIGISIPEPSDTAAVNLDIGSAPAAVALLPDLAQEPADIEAPIEAVTAGPADAPTSAQLETAKSVLAARLAKLNLASTLLAARNAPKADASVTTAPESSVIARATLNPHPPVSAMSQAAPMTLASLQVPADLPGPATPAAPVAPRLPDLQVGMSAPSLGTPVPDFRPKPLVHSKPGAISRPTVTASRTPPAAQPPAADPAKPATPKPAPVLAYAAPQLPEDETSPLSGLSKLFSGGKNGLPGPASKIAVYDISNSTVHMPDGSKLVAHSGIGHRMDNPKYAYVKNLGPTPPNVYKLRMRERRFHGVEAIRMLPYDVPAMRGRDGMLTHSRLLRNSIGSHGCVAFKHYGKFLSAFKKGKVKTMIVVPDMSKLPKYMALYEERKYAAR